MIRPGRRYRMEIPMSTAMGMVMETVNSPQGLDFSALTTTSETAAKRMTRIHSTANREVNPAPELISSLAICPRDFPSRRTEQKSVTKS